MNKGYFGDYGGLFIPETLSHALTELESLYKKIKMMKVLKPNYQISTKTMLVGPLHYISQNL